MNRTRILNTHCQTEKGLKRNLLEFARPSQKFGTLCEMITRTIHIRMGKSHNIYRVAEKKAIFVKNMNIIERINCLLYFLIDSWDGLIKSLKYSNYRVQWATLFSAAYCKSNRLICRLHVLLSCSIILYTYIKANQTYFYSSIH